MSTASADVLDPAPVDTTPRTTWRHNRWLRGLVALLAGAVTGLAWQPYGLWPLLLVGLAFEVVFALLVTYAPPLQAVFETAAPPTHLMVLLLPVPFVIWGVDEVRRALEWLLDAARPLVHHRLQENP